MNSKITAFLLAAAVATVFAGALANAQLGPAGLEAAERDKIGFTDEFFIEDCDFSTTGSNRFFILEPGYKSVLTGENDEGAKVELIITVLDKTKLVDGVMTRVVEERESEDGELVEVSRNYFAFCKQTSSVFYFGEAVDFYENGQIVDHHGSWLAGKNGAKAGLFMPGIVLLNSKYMEETAPGVAMDRGRVVSMDEEIRTPAGKFNNVLKIWETTPLEPGTNEFKFWAADVGLIQDGDLKLKEHGFKK
ncbi:MAG TPA: hypothetical protein VIE86_07195 [Nitrososphaera sp.]|jgi:hypothetical protein